MRLLTSSKMALVGGATLAMAAFVACGGDSDAGKSDAGKSDAGGGAARTVVIKDFKFEPANLKVAPGTRVMVKNQDDDAHTLTANDRSFDTGDIEAKGQKEITVSKAGEISYRCDIHQYMTGVIQVSGS